MGLTNATFGMMGALSVITVPQMMAAQGVPGGQIAALTATITMPVILVALLSPVLDVRFSRRAYAIVTALVTAACVMFATLHRTDVHAIEIAMFIGFAAASLYQGAVGGWMGSLIDHEDDAALGVWFSVANIGAGGLAVVLGGELLRLSAWAAALALGALLLAPLLLFLRIPAPGPDRRLASESFGSFASDIGTLLQQRSVVTALLMFALPSASFALTNVLSGIGADFHASERVVSLAGGIGSSLAAVAGSLAVLVFARRMPLRMLYLTIGVVGAGFTLVLLALPRGPVAYAVAITGENLFQSLAFATANAIAFETMGPGNPLAATLFTVLTAVSNLPILYMGYIDGAAYTRHHIAGAFLIDALLGLTMCALLLTTLRPWHRSATEHPRPS
jgi:PAT family beta-lactamase induction signal transducer AmpG